MARALTLPAERDAYTAAILEVVGGLLLIVGLFSRPVAFVLSGLMAVAYVIGHGPRGFFPVLNGGEAAMLFCFVFLYIAAAGPGIWSIDAATDRTSCAAQAIQPARGWMLSNRISW